MTQKPQTADIGPLQAQRTQCMDIQRHTHRHRPTDWATSGDGGGILGTTTQASWMGAWKQSHLSCSVWLVGCASIT